MLNTQRGFAWMQLLVYAAIASAAIGMAVAAYRWVDSTWQTSAGIAEGRRLENAAMQPQLDACNADLGDANVKLATQSASIAAHAAAAAAQADQARKLAADARAAQADTRTEIQRLGAEIRKGPGTSTCPAGAALNLVRKGLLP